MALTSCRKPARPRASHLTRGRREEGSFRGIRGTKDRTRRKPRHTLRKPSCSRERFHVVRDSADLFGAWSWSANTCAADNAVVVRGALKVWLATLGASEDRVFAILLAVNEAFAERRRAPSRSNLDNR